MAKRPKVMIALILLSICNVLTILFAIWYVRRTIRNTKDACFKLYSDFVLPKKEDELSDLGKSIDYIAHAFSQRFLNTLAAQQMQAASVNSRMVNEIERDIAGDVLASKHPEIGFVLEMLPSVKKRLLKNPSAIQYAMPIISRLAGDLRGGKPTGPDNGHRWEDQIGK